MKLCLVLLLLLLSLPGPGAWAGLSECLSLRLYMAQEAPSLAARNDRGVIALAERFEGQPTAHLAPELGRLILTAPRAESLGGVILARRLKLREPEVINALRVTAADEREPGLRLEAVRALAELGVPVERPFLEELGGKSSIWRPMAAQLLADHYGDYRFHTLYSKVGDFDSFTRRRPEPELVDFAKSGGRNILVGGSYVGKVILRVIPQASLAPWRRAFEATELWKERGFDHVPVEPIASLTEVRAEFPGEKPPVVKAGPLNTQVYTRVLGSDVASIEAALPMSERAEVRRQIGVIRKTLLELGIVHGHTHHNWNFCVNWVDGKIRVYVIDFDRARFMRGHGDLEEARPMRR